MDHRRTIAVLFLAASLQGQVGIIRPGSPAISEPLRQYLELTSAQVTMIGNLSTQLHRFQLEKAQRAGVVQSEIAAEMQRESPDPMALGVRYLELEVIRREQTRETDRVAGEIQQSYTPAQRTKVAALQEVLRSYPIACEALQQGLLSMPQAATPGIGIGPGTVSSGIASSLLGYPQLIATCPTPAFRAGDFMPAPIRPN